MTPQEKANELVENFIQFADDDYWKTKSQYELNETKKANAKQCALIAVDLRIDAYSYPPVGGIDWAEKKEQYWNKVKAEIEKL